MLVRVLGSAAGGSLPQWNCGCAHCGAARADPTQARTTCSVAVSRDGARWVLLNVGSELPAQLASFPALHPAVGTRAVPLAAVVLTDAELDHTLGLLNLRQAMALTVAGTGSVHELLASSGLLDLLGGYLTVEWRQVTVGTRFPLDPADPSGLEGVALAVGGGKPPAYAGDQAVPRDAAVGLQVSDPHSGGRLVYAPCVATLTDELLDGCRSASLVLLDGTFFSDGELVSMAGGRTATQLGHVPVGGPDGSLAQLRPEIRSRLVYTHLNNTNPLLDPQSAASWELHRAGAAVATDGAAYEL